MTGELTRPIACAKCGWEIHTAAEEDDGEVFLELRRMQACLVVAQDALENRRAGGRTPCRLIEASERRE